MSNFYNTLDDVQLNNAWLTIGVFDGIHCGHQEIIRNMTAGAHQNGAPAVVLTFNPHPAKVLSGKEISLLTTPAERTEILFSLGVDAVIELEFTKALAGHSAEDFMAEIVRHTGLKNLVIGHDFALGKGRAGNFQTLTTLGYELGYRVSAIEPVLVDGGLVSSTLIRQLVSSGQVRLAAEKLGRFFSMSGPVVTGDGRGHTIGIPTANVEIPVEKVIPANGVYVCQVEGLSEPDFRTVTAVVNIGLRPTFGSGDLLPRVEAHLLDFTGDLYGKNITLKLIERLRDEQKFDSVAALLTQVQADIQTARKIVERFNLL